jgi:DNA-binding GntR family transcriptional regulator
VGKLDPDDSRPPYRQLADALRKEIQDGQQGPGEKLPSHQVMADEFGVSIGTVKRALGLLQTEGLIVTRQGQGAYVRTDALTPRSSRAESEELADLREAVRALTERVDALEQRVSGS